MDVVQIGLSAGQRGEDCQAIADCVAQAAGSHMANNAVDLCHGRDNLGHEPISTTRALSA
jgi:hypothetical protein